MEGWTSSTSLHVKGALYTAMCSTYNIPLFCHDKKVYLLCFQKYVAVGELGKATDTLDATGIVTLEKDFGKY